MTLLQLQRRMSAAVMRPLTRTGSITPTMPNGKSMRIEAREYIKPNDRLTSKARLEIYNRQYWFRIVDSLYEDFPGLRVVLGQRAFDRMVTAYLDDCPSQSFTMRDLGSRLEEWWRRNPQYAGNRHAFALDMVRLEWAHIEAFDNKAESVLGPEDLLELGPSFRIGLQPYLRLLTLQYPVDDLRISANRASEEHGAVSASVLKQRDRNLVRQVSRLKAERIFLAVHRLNVTVYYRRITSEEFSLLVALREGRPIRVAIRAGFKNSSISPDGQRSLLETRFAAWAELGWLCRPAKACRRE